MDIPGYDLGPPVAGGRRPRVYRGHRQSDRLPVLLKLVSAVDVAQTAAVEREAELLRHLAIDGIARLIEIVHGRDDVALVFDAGETSPLDERLQPGADAPGLTLALNVGIRVAGILDELHRRDIVHGGLRAASVWVDDTGRQVVLTDVDGSVRLDAARLTAPAFATYLSPEQTGRINRDVDYRTDFYALGIVLYELMTGAPPFVSNDAMELLHAHIARTPVSPASVGRDVPDQIGRVVLKLLAKAPDDRYQSAAGILRDLERCRREWTARGTVSPFDPGDDDVPDRFVIPHKLYGREREVASLLSAFESVRAGGTALTLVSGYSGIGKTSLIHELHRPIIRERGHFVAGKFDQVVRNIPFGAVTQALRSLMWQLLAEREERLAALRSRLIEALGVNGGVLAEVIPEVELIIGPQPAPPRLDSAEARNRFLYVFQRFIGTIAERDHPLVVLLDDLQWADPATLDLLHALLTDREIKHVLLIGAYRDNEVGKGHLLTWAVERLVSAGTSVGRISLAPLSEPDLLQFLSDTLRDEPAPLAPLAGLILQKTDGNPFFVIQFLQALRHEQLLTFDYDSRRWRYRIDAIAAAGMTDNVVDLMTRRIRRLSPGAQRTLTLAACVGGEFDATTLVTVGRQARTSVAAALAEAVEAGLVQTITERPSGDHGGPRERFGFVHDRVQQAAYELITDDEQRMVHLDVGRLMLADCAGQPPDERLFEIVNHLKHRPQRHHGSRRTRRGRPPEPGGRPQGQDVHGAPGRRGLLRQRAVAARRFALARRLRPHVRSPPGGGRMPVPGRRLRRGRGALRAAARACRDRHRSGRGAWSAHRALREPIAVGRRRRQRPDGARRPRLRLSDERRRQAGGVRARTGPPA